MNNTEKVLRHFFFVKTTNWNGVIEERSYNTAGQVLTIKTSLHDKTLTDYKYTYDSDGNLIKDGSQVAYQYDKLNRLLKGQGNYTYDAVGNITVSGNHKMTYDDDSRLTSIDDNKTSIDKDGNLTSYAMSGKTHTASYNSQNQLTKYDDLWYTYDADGNRVSAGDVKFIYDDNGHLLSDGISTYVYGASGVVGYYNKDGKFITYLFNQRGDVVKETDETGSVVNSFDYNDYGKLIASDKTVDSVFGYGGQYGAVTDKNGLIYLKTRYYNPEIMRFMNRDTVRGSITDTKSLNRFAYVEGNPLTYVDPNGQAATWLKNNLDTLHSVLSGLSIIPGFNIAASVGLIFIDLAKHDYSALAMDSLGIVIPGVGVAAKLSYNGVKAVVDGAKVGNEVRDVAKANTELVNTFDTYRVVKSETQVSASTEMTTALIVRPKYEIALLSDVQDIDFVAKAKSISAMKLTTLKNDRQVSQEVYDQLRSQTPSAKIRDSVNMGVSIPMDDPVLKGLTVSRRLEADHIVSFDIISRMPNFGKLSFEDQLKVANYEPNFVGLSRSANASKGNKTYAEWTTFKKDNIPVDSSFRKQMMEKEIKLNYELQRYINSMVK